MAGILVTSVIQTYERRLSFNLYVCSAMFGRATMSANGVPNKSLLASLFSDPNVGVQFLKDVGLIRRSMVCCKWGFQLSWYVDTNHNRLPCRTITFVSACSVPRQSGTVHGFSREFH